MSSEQEHLNRGAKHGILITVDEVRRVASLTEHAQWSGNEWDHLAAFGGSSLRTKRSKTVLNSGAYCSGWASTNSMTLR